VSAIPNTFNYHFFPIGQGLFSSGYLQRDGEGQPRYCWVYDCGTSSSDELVSEAINRLDRALGTRKRLDLVTLSHFDDDHISGVCRLIERFKIGTLMLPYMTLANRLIVAFAEGTAPQDGLTDFFVNPVAYLVAQGGPGIERILLVPASGGDGPALPEGTPREPTWDGDHPDIDFHSDKPDDADEWLPLVEAAAQTGSQTQVEYLRRGGALYVGSLWEFVPYNDDPEEEIAPYFVQSVQEERTRLLAARARKSRNNALRQLKKIYDEQFGDRSEERNVISLFLYSGPIYPSWDHAWLANAWQSFGLRRLRALFRREIFFSIAGFRNSQQCSIIYSGDGYLDTAHRLQRLINYFRQERIENTAIFQVMHHGAEANWHKSVAAAIAPRISVFSSDPEWKRLGHPHASVLRDFWPYSPCQVDKVNNLTIFGGLEAR
jgi:hypothetical protein